MIGADCTAGGGGSGLLPTFDGGRGGLVGGAVSESGVVGAGFGFATLGFGLGFGFAGSVAGAVADGGFVADGGGGKVWVAALVTSSMPQSIAPAAAPRNFGKCFSPLTLRPLMLMVASS